MTPEVLAYLQRSVAALAGNTSLEDQAKILRTMSQLTAMAANEATMKLELERDINNA